MKGTSKHLGVVGLAVAAMLAAGCQGSATNVVGPGGTKCAISLQPSAPSIAAAGGQGTITVTAAAECVWRASTNASWISLTSNPSGQGAAVIHFTASENPANALRKAAVIVAESRVELSQAGAPCQFTLSPASETFGPGSEEGAVNISAAIGCEWSATSSVPWLSIVGSAAGVGSSIVRYRVGANEGSTRDGTLTIGGQTFVVNQGGTATSCTVGIGAAGRSVPAAGADDLIPVTAAGRCPWVATSRAPWITITDGASGSGAGTVRLSIAQNHGAPRVGLVTITGHTYVVTQAGTAEICSYTIDAPGHSAPAGAGTATVTVSSQPGCRWAATSHVSWITVTSGASGNGTGPVILAIAVNTGSERVGQVTIAGRSYVVTQAAAAPGGGGTGGGGTGGGDGGSGGGGGTGGGDGGSGGGGGDGGGDDGTGGGGGSCSFSVGLNEQSVGSSGGPAMIDVTTTSGCAWTATSNAEWISVTGGATGSGPGRVQLTIAPNTGTQRVGTVTVAGRTHTITQASGLLPCSYSLSSGTHSSGASGGTTSISVTTTGSCQWTAKSHSSWIAITAGATGTGPGTVQLNIAANAGAERVGTLTIAEQTFTVSQAAAVLPCSFSLNANTYSSPASGGTTSVGVTTASGCAWTAESHASWITISNRPSGTGNGVVQLSIAASTGGERIGTLTIAGRTFTVTQAAAPQPCTYSLNPASQTVSLLGGEFTVTVTTQDGCAWTASTPDGWITFTTTPEGVGSGSVRYRIPTVSLGLLFSRQGSITIGGQVLTVQQKGVLANGS